MEELAKRIGEVAVGAIIDAIQAGRSRAEALDAAAAAVKREDVVSDDLWEDLGRYITSTKDFVEHGA